MFFYLLLLFVVTPIVELALLLRLGAATEWYWPVVLVIVTGIVGAALARREGTAVLRRIHDELERGAMPADGLVDGLFVLVGGALLITPGVLTDAVGFACLIPPSRRLLKAVLKRWFRRGLKRGRFVITTHRPPPRDDDDWLPG